MKQFAAAFIISMVLVAAYWILAIVISGVLGSGPMEVHPSLSWPLSLPRMVYTAIAPDFIQNAAVQSPLGGLAERVTFFFGNVLIYSLPVYALITTFRKRRGARETPK